MSFKTNKTAVLDNRNITLGLNDVDLDDKFMIGDRSLDDCGLGGLSESQVPEKYKGVYQKVKKEFFTHLNTI